MGNAEYLIKVNSSLDEFDNVVTDKELYDEVVEEVYDTGNMNTYVPTEVIDYSVSGTDVWLGSMIIKLTIVLCFVMTSWLALRMLDLLNGFNYSNWLNNLDDDNKTKILQTRYWATTISIAIVYAFGSVSGGWM